MNFELFTSCFILHSYLTRYLLWLIKLLNSYKSEFPYLDVGIIIPISWASYENESTWHIVINCSYYYYYYVLVGNQIFLCMKEVLNIYTYTFMYIRYKILFLYDHPSVSFGKVNIKCIWKIYGYCFFYHPFLKQYICSKSRTQCPIVPMVLCLSLQK